MSKSKKSALIAELLEYGIHFKYREYYDLYSLGPSDTPNDKKRARVADIVRKWRKNQQKITGKAPPPFQIGRKPIPQDFSREDHVMHFQRYNVTTDENGDIVSERYRLPPKDDVVINVKDQEKWKPFLTTLDTSTGRQWVRYKEVDPEINDEAKGVFERVKAELERKSIERTYKSPKVSKGTVHGIVMGCVHIPFQNKHLMDGVFHLMQDFKFDIIVAAGDVADMRAISSHDKDNVKPYTLWEEYQECIVWRKTVDSLMKSGSEKVWLNGNHEDRYYRLISKYDYARFGDALIGPDQGIGLTANGWDYLANYKEDRIFFGDLEIAHGSKTGTSPWKQHAEISASKGKNLIFFHSHRFGSHTTNGYTAWNCGMLGQIGKEGFGYADRDSRDKWSNGFATFTIEDGKCHVHPVQCSERNFWYFGKKYGS